AAGLAHEIRNPLGALQANLQIVGATLGSLRSRLAEESVPPRELADLEEPLADCERAAASILEITRSVELTTRQSDDGLVDLSEVVSLATRSIRAQINRLGEVDLQLEPLPAVRGSRTRLGQVVLNLVLNALEAMDPIDRRRNRVVVRLFGSAGAQCLEVEDNGPGIPPKTLAKIFDPFFTTKSNGGSGLGLAISKRIVDELGGSLEVSSEVGVGTRFRVSLPSAQEA
ncbi:MAG TPA: HAMP domain-containing sensor histidine kinase, partial [Vulgatibacter sp.]